MPAQTGFALPVCGPRLYNFDPTADGVKKKINDLQDRRGRAQNDRSKASQ